MYSKKKQRDHNSCNICYSQQQRKYTEKAHNNNNDKTGSHNRNKNEIS